VVSWAGSVQGPYPVGNPSAQPDMKLALASPWLLRAVTRVPSPLA